MPETVQLVTFYLSDLLFGIDVRSVQEITRNQKITKVPLAGASVLGLINLRGQIVTVIDLKERLEIPGARGASGRTAAMNVVVRAEGGPLSLQVDRIGDVLEVDETIFEPTPHTVKPSVRALLAGIYKLEARFLHVLAVERLVDFRSRATAQPTHDQWTDKPREDTQGAERT